MNVNLLAFKTMLSMHSSGWTDEARAAVSLFDKIVPYYEEPHRSYHNIDHIVEMLMYALTTPIQLTPAQLLAIMCHDIVYVPTSNEGANEEMSVVLMYHLVRKFTHPTAISESTLEAASRIILDTIDHHPMSEESMVVTDLDMMRLGQSYDQFKAHDAAVRREYCVPDTVWKSGRVGFMLATLQLEKIFYTTHFHTTFESQARSNLLRLIEEYESKETEGSNNSR